MGDTYKVQIDREQSLELRAAVAARITDLEKIRKTLVGHGLSASAVDERLVILRGDDDTTGLRDVIQEQITLFEQPDTEGLFSEGDTE